MHDRFHWNVMSGRYSKMPAEAWTPSPKDIRGQGTGNKQVASGEMSEDLQRWASSRIAQMCHAIRTAYKDLLDSGVGREQARTVLPLGQYTEAYVTANLGDWLLFLKQRLDPHAQLEIKAYAEAVYNILQNLFPVTMKAFADYQLGGVKFSIQEMRTLKSMLNGAMGNWLDEHGNPSGGVHLNELIPKRRKEILKTFINSKRERAEFWNKINNE